MIVLAMEMDSEVVVHVVDGDKIVSDDNCCGVAIGGEIENLKVFNFISSFMVACHADHDTHGHLPRHLEPTQTRLPKPS